MGRSHSKKIRRKVGVKNCGVDFTTMYASSRTTRWHVGQTCSLEELISCTHSCRREKEKNEKCAEVRTIHEGESSMYPDERGPLGCALIGWKYVFGMGISRNQLLLCNSHSYHTEKEYDQLPSQETSFAPVHAVANSGCFSCIITTSSSDGNVRVAFQRHIQFNNNKLHHRRHVRPISGR
ncbi:hypothetical protein KIN20_018765 [Parelaphostrongylus tenuis]|uniref:Uncharacterized protein n=1 Tax=Parelaphostrongylus tenuis TaxID=148309 RepID=A0AAD5QUM3_PARTN|nr:hypothetical protein KIN20_018765 [Parelaphostrongylus tenuis]